MPSSLDRSGAVEVITLFEGVIVDIRYLSKPEVGDVTGATKGMLGLAFGAIFGVAPSRDQTEPRHFTLGPRADASFPTPGALLPFDNFPLVRATGTDYELIFTPTMSGDVTLPDRDEDSTIPLGRLAQSGAATLSPHVDGALACPISDGMRAKVDLGHNTFLISAVEAPHRYRLERTIDWSRHAYTVGVALAAALVLLMMFLLPPDPGSHTREAFGSRMRVATFMTRSAGPNDRKRDGSELGTHVRNDEDRRASISRPKHKLSRRIYRPHAENAMQSTELQREAVLVNDGTTTASIIGLVGTGRHGDSIGTDTVGVSDLLVKAPRASANVDHLASWAGSDCHAGFGRCVEPDVVPGNRLSRGSLAKEIIRRVIRSHVNEVKFCYEKELARTPNLVERADVHFSISSTGVVTGAMIADSPRHTSRLHECIIDVVLRWTFPAPKGGGIALVSYPFLLHTANGD